MDFSHIPLGLLASLVSLQKKSLSAQLYSSDVNFPMELVHYMLHKCREFLLLLFAYITSSPPPVDEDLLSPSSQVEWMIIVQLVHFVPSRQSFKPVELGKQLQHCSSSVLLHLSSQAISRRPLVLARCDKHLLVFHPIRELKPSTDSANIDGFFDKGSRLSHPANVVPASTIDQECWR